MEFNERLEYMAVKGVSVTLTYHSEADKWVCIWMMADGKIFMGESKDSPDYATMDCCDKQEAGKSLSD